MIDESRLKQLNEFFDSYSKEELIWINGYLSGIVTSGNQNGSIQLKSHDKNTVGIKKITLVYGTETGNSKKIATQFATLAKKKALNLKLFALDQYRLQDLSKEECLFIVISTQGEGEPPAPARKFYDFIHSNELRLPDLKFGVLALGDSSYPLFCKTGEDVDTQLSKFGATRVLPLQKCDADFEEEAVQWFERVMNFLGKQPQTNLNLVSQPVGKKTNSKKYYNGTILANINLNDRGSNKQTFHIEIGTDEDIAYEPGDTIGIIPRNRQEVVKRIIEITGIDANQDVQTAKATASVAELLTQHLNICYLLTSTIKKYAAIIQQVIPDTRMDLVDLLRINPVKDSVQFEEVLKILTSISPRLYTVSSSPTAHGNSEVHITVARNQFHEEEEQKFGLCSEFLGDQPVGSTITFYVHKDKNFKLPAADKDVIMIGPGTGVAPFRSFLAERDATGATGRNWFFFGEQHFTTDFLYQTEIQNYVSTGVLTNIDLAFSRDQQEKVYVQHRMKQRSIELFSWIEKGASVFVSGTKDPMSIEVENTLLAIIEERGTKTADEAKQYLAQLKKEGRYEKDVY